MPKKKEKKNYKLRNIRALLKKGDPTSAYLVCQKCLESNPFDADILNLAGVSAFQVGAINESYDYLQAAASYRGDDPEIHTNLGNVLAHFGKEKEASNAYEKAISINPNYCESFFNYALLLDSQGLTGAAIEAFEKTLKISGRHTLAIHGLGNVLNKLGHLERAKSIFIRCVKNAPKFEAARINLAAVLHELGDFVGAVKHCRQLIKTSPDILEARYNLAINLQELGQYEEAIRNYKQVLSLQPGHAAAAMNLGCVFREIGELTKAKDALILATQIDPNFAQAHLNLSDLMLQMGEWSAAMATCNEFLENNAGDTTLLAYKTILLSDHGEERAASDLVNLASFLSVQIIKCPSIYDTLNEFNAALCVHLENHQSLTYAPRSHATRKSKHSGELLVEPKGPIAELEKVILGAVDRYQSELDKEQAHPFVERCPNNLELSVWGVVMGGEGHQIPHIHPSAWLSGVYYAKIPDSVGSDDISGWIKFGLPPEHFHNSKTPQTKSIRPREGLLILFPSYYYHHTIPHNSEDTRISIAFDLIDSG